MTSVTSATKIKANRLNGYVNKINHLPLFCRSFLLTRLFCSQVKFANTAGVKLRKIKNDDVLLTLANKKRVQNHIGGIHAVAAALLAESTTGIILGLNLPDSRLPLLKSMSLNYYQRMQGDLTATAHLTTEQISQIQVQEKGDLIIPVEITDESGQAPIVAEMHWAWINKKHSKKS
jgi:acyl-coenzyme A thioesterase PaaI-like protein